MNIILIQKEELTGNRAVIRGERHAHMRSVLKCTPGKTIKAGILNGLMGTADVVSINDDEAVLDIAAAEKPPAPREISVILALPRPKVFRRIFFFLVCAGIKDIHIINTWRVEKSYWKSPYLENTGEYAFEALQQAKDTIMPKVSFHRFFMDFVKNELPEISKDKSRWLAEPTAEKGEELKEPAVIAIGPEGGFIQREIDTFIRCGFKGFSFGERILTTEHAVPYIIGRFG
ncbi:16S rRNA (uracil(1498)-N(3))-methyltransferase [Limisalsivibrio acetivorans]|uniref:16S rRNA (uracil(1498)-N(3))-methyltransferase n=1 Tax=Limisalsivibrio acetivorans TaxID=1304888 RepID=UPI0003B6D8B8|nr:RsmE family RNA methyltransferase [Limisalsivibrio acetivorans]